MKPKIHAWLAGHADDYRRLQASTGAGAYPFGTNACGKCGRESDRPLAPASIGWLCVVCAYPGETDLEEEWL